jgi:peptidyl-prolyl cis-trans isomerase D
MAIIGKIRKHSGLVVIVVGVAIAAFVIGDFSKKRPRSVNEIGDVNGEVIPIVDFNTKVDESIEIQKENSKSDKITDEETYNIRQSTWSAMTREILMGNEYELLGLTVTPEELFDQVQGKNPHRYILQYFKDPKTNQYDPALVLNYLKNLDKMEPKAKTQWLRFEKAIKEDRQQNKYNNLISKGYYIPKAFAEKQYQNQTRSLTVRYVAPAFANIPDSTIKLTDADYENYYNKNKQYFYQDEAYRDIDYVVFEVVPSDVDRKKIAQDVTGLYNDFQISNDIPNFINANSDKKYDSTFVKKGTLPGKLDSLAFTSAPGTFFPPFEKDGKAWYMAKLLAVQERPDSIKASHILIGFAGTQLAESQKITRTKDQAKKMADSILLVLKKNPEKLADLAKTISDYPTAKDDGGDLKWLVDGDPGFYVFFNAALTMKPGELKVVETGVGYSVFNVKEKTKSLKKVKMAVLQINIEPSNQTFQDTYLKASAFAGQNKTAEAFEKSATAQKLNKRNAANVKDMDNQVSGLTSARELVRWAYGEEVKISDVSPVFDLNGKYVVAILKKTSEKGLLPLDKVKDRIEPNVKNYKKIELLAARMTKAYTPGKDLYALAVEFNAKVDTTNITFTGYGRVAIANEGEIVGNLFTLKTGIVSGPLIGNYGAYYVIVDKVSDVPKKEDFTNEKSQLRSEFEGRVANSTFTTLQKTAKIKDNRSKFF